MTKLIANFEKRYCKDKRHPELEKVGCYFKGNGEGGFVLGNGKEGFVFGSDANGFVFFSEWKSAKDGDVFIYNQGILWRVRK